ncbi:hypothetical protein ACUNWD_07950 [Sunxiuqinia sp. A32]|uniref:hypothetical protein n=1 Tax=Sunxiuqinia sp. A32 TaxID=3461496 RepID=UPI0040456266
MKKIILFLALTITASNYVLAQREMKIDDEWMQKIRAEKIAFLTNKLSLTPKEAQDFWPIYNEFEEKRFEIHMKRRHMEHETMDKTEGLTDSELKAISNDFINLFQKEADIMKEYNKKFFNVLPAEKVVRFYDVENDFRSHLLQEFRKERKNGEPR